MNYSHNETCGICHTDKWCIHRARSFAEKLRPLFDSMKRAELEQELAQCSDQLRLMQSKIDASESRAAEAEKSSLAPIMHNANGDICGVCGGDVSKGQHHYKQCAAAIEASEQDAMCRLVDADSRAALAESRLAECREVLQELETRASGLCAYCGESPHYSECRLAAALGEKAREA